ncbi:hypothetical protein DKB58_09660 [Capnocytophaga canimorsus]|nr:hypothetical protein DKB58_09660 [Capnocytophaga canimorsus]AYW37781.1 hypothetical protein D8L92_11145 [Capnocytophaga canimorsus]
MLTINQLLRFLPFILLGLYYFFVLKSSIDFYYKLIILVGILFTGLWVYYKKEKNTKTNRLRFYLFLGISIIIILMHYI